MLCVCVRLVMCVLESECCVCVCGVCGEREREAGWCGPCPVCVVAEQVCGVLCERCRV